MQTKLTPRFNGFGALAYVHGQRQMNLHYLNVENTIQMRYSISQSRSQLEAQKLNPKVYTKERQISLTKLSKRNSLRDTSCGGIVVMLLASPRPPFIGVSSKT